MRSAARSSARVVDEPIDAGLISEWRVPAQRRLPQREFSKSNQSVFLKKFERACSRLCRFINGATLQRFISASGVTSTMTTSFACLMTPIWHCLRTRTPEILQHMVVQTFQVLQVHGRSTLSIP